MLNAERRHGTDVDGRHRVEQFLGELGVSGGASRSQCDLPLLLQRHRQRHSLPLTEPEVELASIARV